jgi:hypothetical protein
MGRRRGKKRPPPGRPGVQRERQPGRPRMSEVLAEVAQPVLDGLELPEHAPEFQLCLVLAAGIWNAAALESETERERAMTEVRRSLGVLMNAEMHERCDEVYRLSRIRQQTESRVIAGVELVRETETRFRIDVASVGV